MLLLLLYAVVVAAVAVVAVVIVVVAVVVGDDDAIALYCYSTVSTKSCQGSISPTFYAQFLRVQIPKAQKKINGLNVFLHFGDLCKYKAARKMLVKSTPWLNSIFRHCFF